MFFLHLLLWPNLAVMSSPPVQSFVVLEERNEDDCMMSKCVVRFHHLQPFSSRFVVHIGLTEN